MEGVPEGNGTRWSRRDSSCKSIKGKKGTRRFLKDEGFRTGEGAGKRNSGKRKIGFHVRETNAQPYWIQKERGQLEKKRG